MSGSRLPVGRGAPEVVSGSLLLQVNFPIKPPSPDRAQSQEMESISLTSLNPSHKYNFVISSCVGCLSMLVALCHLWQGHCFYVCCVKEHGFKWSGSRGHWRQVLQWNIRGMHLNMGPSSQASLFSLKEKSANPSWRMVLPLLYWCLSVLNNDSPNMCFYSVKGAFIAHNFLKFACFLLKFNKCLKKKPVDTPRVSLPLRQSSWLSNIRTTDCLAHHPFSDSLGLDWSLGICIWTNFQAILLLLVQGPYSEKVCSVRHPSSILQRSGFSGEHGGLQAAY
jgi:hypothetical protein